MNGAYGQTTPAAAVGAYFPYQAPRPMGAYFPYQAPMAGGAMGNANLQPLATTMGVVWLISRGLGGYLVGRAVAPDEDSRGTYSWVGALVGTFMGPIGLGVMGVIAMEAKD